MRHSETLAFDFQQARRFYAKQRNLQPNEKARVDEKRRVAPGASARTGKGAKVPTDRLEEFRALGHEVPRDHYPNKLGLNDRPIDA